MEKVVAKKLWRALCRGLESCIGRLQPIGPTLEALAVRPYELHLELTNVCNAKCIFCPYQYQQRPASFMSDDVFHKAVDDFIALGGGSVGLTPIVGEALIDPKFLERVRYLRSQAAIDRVWVTTNAILLEKLGIEAVLSSGLTAITISTSGFDASSYQRIYRSNAYEQVRAGVTKLLEANARRSRPIGIFIGLRTDRKLASVMNDPDFQPILKFGPEIDFTWSFTSAGGRVRSKDLPGGFKLRIVRKREETCVQLYNGPIVLADGKVLACSCLAAMDAIDDLGIGNILTEDLGRIWSGESMRQLRAGFKALATNRTCAACDMYRDLSLLRTSEGRLRAKLNRQRAAGQAVKRLENADGAFSGG